MHTYTRVHTCTYVRRGVRVQVCTTRDSSTSSTIHRVRRSTPPRFNIQTICNNFAATITPFLPPPCPCPTSLLISQHSCFLRLSLSLALALSILLLKPPSSASPSLSFIPSPLFPPPSPNSPVSFPFLSRPTVFLPPHEETWHVRTHPHRDFARLLYGVVHCTSIFHPATAITLNRRAGINI